MYNHHEVFLHCWLENAGPSTASELFVLCEVPHNMPSPQYDHRLWEESASGRPGHAFIAKRSVHPDERLNLFDIQLGSISKEKVKSFSNDCFTFKFSLSARNQTPTKCTITVRAQDVEEAGVKKATPVM